MERYGIKWERKGTHEKHLSVLDYKKQQRTEEIERLENKITDKQTEFETLSKRIENFDKGTTALSQMQSALENETPSLAISLYGEYRHLGIGTALMKAILHLLKEKGYKQTSLSVQKENYAVNMYQKIGFKVVSETEEEYIMVCELQ